MVTTKKIRWIPLMMIISQVMLTGFVLYWLKNQYDDEKDLLRNDLTRIYDETRNQVIDSLLFTRVVEPALKDSVTITMIASDRSDSVTGKASRAATASVSFNHHEQDVLVRSIKLLIRQQKYTMAGNVTTGLLSDRIDTALFKKLYNEKILQRKYGITAIWTGDSVNTILGTSYRLQNHTSSHLVNNNITLSHLSSSTGKKSTIHIASQLPDQWPAVQIKQAFPYLIRRISPQILFGLILLVLTGSAFFFTNRSLKRQLILNGLRNDFVSNITHELRTPVSTVKVALEALKTYDKVRDPIVTREYLDMAAQELNRLDQLISKVLDQSLIGEHKEMVRPELCDILALTEQVLQTLQPRLTNTSTSVNYQHEEMDGTIMIDPIYFQGVLMNLIDNSLKYVRGHLLLSIRIWPEKNFIVMEVSDNGPGIPKEYIGRVFDKFFRVPSGNIHNVKGYGLGLSFAALVMEQHRGSISVRNLDPQGCAFTLRFPKNNP